MDGAGKNELESALERLGNQPGFTARAGQRHLAHLLYDCLVDGSPAAFEAPTGLGKSLAILLGAITAHQETGERIVIATYTNVLAEQYWSKDVPFALQLFENPPKIGFLLGRSRYACQRELSKQEKTIRLSEGHEIEWFRNRSVVKGKRPDWKEISVPNDCEGRFCPFFRDCYLYNARKQAQSAKIVVTNHSVVLQDALLAQDSEGESSLLGPYDRFIIDEGHDFISAAQSGLEMILSRPGIGRSIGFIQRISEECRPYAVKIGAYERIHEIAQGSIDVMKGLDSWLETRTIPKSPELFHVSPEPLKTSQGISDYLRPKDAQALLNLTKATADSIESFLDELKSLRLAGAQLSERDRSLFELALDSRQTMVSMLGGFATLNRALLESQGVEVLYSIVERQMVAMRKDILDLRGLLDELLWSKKKAVFLSATLAIDRSFEFFSQQIGFTPLVTEILESPFDFGRQAALYSPGPGVIPDPTIARREGLLADYYHQVAQQIESMITLIGGRTLALFPSRVEMEAVYERVSPREDLPILIQPRGASAGVGEKFKRHPEASLFALRSFWTGFDAPGETCACVVIVRIPFEVPYDPPSLVRSAWMQSDGRDSFREWTLPTAKTLIRQGVGRLIRRESDRGIIAILDPRLRTKRYGEEILENLPPGMRVFDDAADAAGWLGLGAAPQS